MLSSLLALALALGCGEDIADPGPPRIGVSQIVFGFEMTENGGNPASQAIAVANAGGGTLVWSASPNQLWLSMDPSVGASEGEVNECTITVDGSMLTPGDYAAEITIVAADAENSPRIVGVSLSVDSRPVIETETDQVTVVAPLGSTDSIIVPLTVSDGNTEPNPLPLDWAAYELPDRTWLGLGAPAAGGDGDQLQIALDPTGLAVGSYATVIQLTDTNAENSPLAIPASLEILPLEAGLQVSKDALYFACYVGGAAGDQHVEITNGGYGTLEWSATDNASAPDWLTTSPTGGQTDRETDTLTVSVDPSLLGVPGTYEADITVVATDTASGDPATNSPATIHVVLAIYEANWSLLFDNDDCVDFGSYKALYPSTGFTWECWAKLDGSSIGGACISAYDTAWGQDIILRVNTSTFTFVVYGDGWDGPARSASYSPPGGVDPDTWYHVAGVADYAVGKLRVYVDGASRAQGNWDLNPLNRDMPVSLGYGGTRSINVRFDGLMDEVRIWNYARSEADTLAQMAVPLTGQEPGLVAYWSADEGAGQTLLDLGPTGYDGRLGTTTGADASDPTWSADTPF